MRTDRPTAEELLGFPGFAAVQAAASTADAVNVEDASHLALRCSSLKPATTGLDVGEETGGT